VLDSRDLGEVFPREIPLCAAASPRARYVNSRVTSGGRELDCEFEEHAEEPAEGDGAELRLARQKSR